MVFANLSAHEKDAFFSLLDEYFASRPEIFAGSDEHGGGPTSSAAAAAATSAVHRALASNPEATSKIVSAGLKHGVPKSSPYAAAASNPELSGAIGRVAAASLAFSAPGSGNNGSGGGGLNSRGQPPPPAPPRRTASSSSSTPKSIADNNKTEEGKPGLVTTRKIGGVDISSTKNMFGSLLKSSPQTPPVVPSAFQSKKGAFAPPPRRVGSGTAPTPPRRQPEPEPEDEEEEEEEGEEGEWAEALYDYSSGDPGDLEIQAKQRILVVERTSDDWWTGEVDGRRGLFPASYVTAL